MVGPSDGSRRALGRFEDCLERHHEEARYHEGVIEQAGTYEEVGDEVDWADQVDEGS